LASKKQSSSQSVAAVDRALSIVLALVSSGEALSLAELSRQTSLYKSTLLRLIASLELSSLVVARTDKKYCLGPLAFRLGQSFESTYHLGEHVLPSLRHLVNQGTESASFHVRHDRKQRLCLFRADSNHSTLDRVKAGDLAPIDRGAAGKAIRVFEQPLSEVVIRGMDVMMTSFGERNPGIAGIAAPVFGVGGKFYGVISLTGPIERFTESNTRKMTRLLIKACETVTLSLGGIWPWR